MIDGFKRNSTIYVGDAIVRKTDSRLSNGKDIVVCLPGARIEHVTERVEQIMGRGNGGSIVIHIGTNNADKGPETIKKSRAGIGAQLTILCSINRKLRSGDYK